MLHEGAFVEYIVSLSPDNRMYFLGRLFGVNHNVAAFSITYNISVSIHTVQFDELRTEHLWSNRKNLVRTLEE